ncbi:ABC-type dipeptide/oligopeptide/nickel transport system ATPase component [Homoserinimonas aerilata]|uniref:ABC-type dipeptide/oligopeptide/nickel transport system ATPase component n=1 Tax=Homoserinimonas aerilata TaxID=1162970 RepID=A0A542YIF3_9MICO|nr:ATP-binding cassette domain-containing protein [Homoserinimonas aerilata]TQL47867.1 ABC-type dipeptide/oligopeptide/nickel transport system ATPase component [Homoserinimonas aerilata]
MRVTAGEAGAVVSARDLSVHYLSRNASSYHLALDGLTFDVAAGEVLGVVGESGSGKSTLARAVAGLTGLGQLDDGIPEIRGGSLRVLGTDIRGISRRQRDRLTGRVGYLAQNGAVTLNPRLTVGENVAEPIFERDRRFRQKEATAIVASLVDSVHLPLSVLPKQPHELSSGQRQRVALARALVLEPSLLVADEPTRGVDATVKSGVLGVLRELQLQRGFSALVVSSDLAVVSAMTERVAVLSGGVLIGIGPLESLLEHPTHPYLEALAAVREGYRDERDGD